MKERIDYGRKVGEKDGGKKEGREDGGGEAKKGK